MYALQPIQDIDLSQIDFDVGDPQSSYFEEGPIDESYNPRTEWIFNHKHFQIGIILSTSLDSILKIAPQ